MVVEALLIILSSPVIHTDDIQRAPVIYDWVINVLLPQPYLSTGKKKPGQY
jgi:hypothetical protein